MKTHIVELGFLVCLSIFLLPGCGGDEGGSNTAEDERGTRALVLKTNAEGAIATVADVDWYSITLDEPAIVAITVYNQTLRYDVDILATVYEQDSNGNLIRLAADHFTENAASSSSLTINVNVSQAKTLLVAVRDLDDNDASATETYTIAYDIAAPEDNNGSFDSAVNIALNSSCHTDTIGTVGDTDVMRFTLAEDGVYELATEFNAFDGGTAVSLKTALYSSEGELVRSQSQTVDSVYRMVESLSAGNYFLLVHDQGKDNFDTASPFTTCLTQVSTNEVSSDDSQANATSLSGDGHFTLSGSIDYAGDEDWSSLQSGAAPVSIQVLQIEFDPSQSNGCNGWYLLEIIDANDVVLFSKEYSSETGARTAHIKVENSGEHFVRVSAIDNQVCSLNGETGMPYQATIDVIDVSDDAELGAANNTINNATELDETSAETTEAMLSYVGDVDWYRITVDPQTDYDRVLEIFIESEAATPLEYYVRVFRFDEILDTLTGRESEDIATRFKTSYFVPRASIATNIDYFIKIVDMQSDEADINNGYTVRTNLVAVNTQAPVLNNERVSNAQFFSESDEQAQLALGNNELELVISADKRNAFSYRDSGFGLTPEQVSTQVVAEANTLTVSFPWQSGYIDYYHDRDWHQLDLDAIYSTAGGSDDSWYVEIQVELYSPAPGSTVEYAWGLYRDANGNSLINDWESDDGLFASNGDTNAQTSLVDLTTPAADASGPMWLSHETAQDPFYITVADIINESTNTADNDWGYDQPYYLRVSLVYHSGASQPES